MNRKAKLLIGAFALGLLGLGATFAVAQYRMGIGGHYGAMGGWDSISVCSAGMAHALIVFLIGLKGGCSQLRLKKRYLPTSRPLPKQPAKR